MQVVGLILAGGSGTRLWPLSRKKLPKQLLSLTGNKSLLQETSRRIKPIITEGNQWVITNNELYEQVIRQLFVDSSEFQDLDNHRSNISILKEPEAKSTAPAIIWAAFRCLKQYGDDSIMVISPSDHMIINEQSFLGALKVGIDKASEGCLVTLGIVPTYPETGFGYVKINGKAEDSKKIYPVEVFVEKPDIKTATLFLNENTYLWNSGILIFHVKTLLQEAEVFCPDLYNAFLEADPFSEQEISNAFDKVQSISIDYAVMEFTKKAYVIKADFGWSDVGSWKSLFEISLKDEDGNVVCGDHITIDTKNSYIYSRDRLIVSLGLNEITIVDTEDALFVAPLEQTNRISEVMEKLKEQNRRVHIEHTTPKKI